MTPEDAKIAVATLTTKQRDCLVLMCKGLNAKDVAKHMGCGVHAANDLLKRAYRKLDAEGRVEAAVIAAKAGIA